MLSMTPTAESIATGVHHYADLGNIGREQK